MAIEARLCRACGREGAKMRCSRCRDAESPYCNRECQAKDWRRHKQDCPPQTSTQTSSQASVRASSTVDLQAVPVPITEPHPLPDPRHFPEGLREFAYWPSPDGVDANLLLLLHGLGDKHRAFSALGQKLALPQTAVLALSGPLMIPETNGGRGWFTAFDDDWELIKPSLGERRRFESLLRTRGLLEDLLKTLEVKYRWARRQVHVFGFSQGGTVALDLAMRSCGATRLGSAVAVSASLLPEAMEEMAKTTKCQQDCTPLLITHGDKDDVVPRKDVLSTVGLVSESHPRSQPQLHTVENKGHGMMSSESETRAVMTFWAKHLSHRLQGQEQAGLVEITKGGAEVLRGQN